MHPALIRPSRLTFPRSLAPLAWATLGGGVLGLCSIQAQDAAEAPPIIAVAATTATPPAAPATATGTPTADATATPKPDAEQKPAPTPGVPANIVTGTTSLTAPDDERPLQYVVPDKKRVSKGELLALFENSSLYAALGTAQKELKALKAATAAAQKEATNVETGTGEKIANASFEIKKAEKALSKYVEGDAPAAEIALTLALADAEENFKQQTERYNVRDKMLEEGYIRKVEYDNEEHLLQKTRLLRDAAKLRLDAFLKYDKEQTIDQLTRALNDKKVAFEKLQEDSQASITKAQRAIEACGKAETVKTKECEQLTKQIEATIILAPRDGTFAYKEGSKFVIGNPVAKGGTLGSIEK